MPWLSCLLKPNEFGKITISSFLLMIIGLTLYSQIALFKDGLDFLSLRFEEAANVEGNPVEAYFVRYMEIILAPVNMFRLDSINAILGYGIGSGTRAGSALGRGVGFELDWARHMYESVQFWGGIYVIFRLWICKDLLSVCILRIKNQSYLSILLWGAAAPVLLLDYLDNQPILALRLLAGGSAWLQQFLKKPETGHAKGISSI